MRLQSETTSTFTPLLLPFARISPFRAVQSEPECGATALRCGLIDKHAQRVCVRAKRRRLPNRGPASRAAPRPATLAVLP